MHVHADPPVTPASFLFARRRLLLGIAGLVALLAVVAAFASNILLTWDEPIQKGVEANRTSTLDQLFLTVSRFGSTIPVLTLGALGAIFTWRRCQAVSIALVAATLLRPLVEFTLKASVDRARPNFDQLVNGEGPSFPSGHPMAAMALWGLLPVVVGLYTQRRAIWWMSVALAVGLIGGIAASRVYLGVHWFTDVFAGLMVGSLFLLGVELLFHRAHERYPCNVPGCPEVDAQLETVSLKMEPDRKEYASVQRD